MIFIYLIIFLIAGYFLSALFVYFLQDKIIFLPGKEIFRTPDDEGMIYEDIDLFPEDGISIHAWFIPNAKREKTILFCHGNAGTLSNRIDTLRLFYELGFSILIFDYRGYGISDGSPSEKGTTLDTESAYKFLVENKNIKPEDIIAWGRSMGGPIAAKLAKDHKVGACVLESTFTSIKDMAKVRFKIFPSKLLSKYSYPTLEYVRDIDVPILIVHSPDDEIIPYRMGKKIFETANEPKTFMKLRGDHNNTYFDSYEEYINGLNSFFS